MIKMFDPTIQALDQNLNLRLQNQNLISSNIANADTPNYKATDMNFAEALRRAQSDTPKAVVVQTTSPGHITPSSVTHSLTQVSYHTVNASQPAADGNTVEMDAERAKFVDNSVRYEAAFRFLNHQIKALLSAIQG